MRRLLSVPPILWFFAGPGPARADDRDKEAPPLSSPVSLKGTLPAIPRVPKPVQGGRVLPQGGGEIARPAPAGPSPSEPRADAAPPEVSPKEGVRVRVVTLDDGGGEGRKASAWSWSAAAALAAALAAVLAVFLKKSRILD